VDSGAVVDPLLTEGVERLLISTATFEAVEQAEADRWCAPVWDALAEAGFPWVSVSEEAGGSGGTLADAMAVLRSLGRRAAPVPVAETILGSWLMAEAGFELPPSPLSVVPDPTGLRLDGTRIFGNAVVAWAERAFRFLAIVSAPDGPVIVSLAPDQVDIAPRANMAGEPRDLVWVDLSLADVESAPAPMHVDGEALQRRGCLTRVVMAAGALESMTKLTVDYANERQQFGRPIAAFQAVQQHLVTVAQCSIRASMAADLATRAFAHGDGAFEVAAARVVVDAATVEGTRAAHQAHGAIGVTREYPLHHLSRRLWAWRHEFVSANASRRQLGHAMGRAGGDQLFPNVTR
jgi:acyl-CoA dehydrogenase